MRGTHPDTANDVERRANRVENTMDHIAHSQEARTNEVDVGHEANMPVQDLSDRWHRLR